MLLTLFASLAAMLCGAYYLRVRHRPYEAFRDRSIAGALIFGALAVFMGYFTWREARALDEIAAVIAPIPEITDIMRVPSPGEIQAVANTLADVPVKGQFGTSQGERRQLADDLQDLHTQYWQVHTTLSPEGAFEFYRDEASRNDWEIETDKPPFLVLRRTGQRLTLFIQEDWKRADTEVWYVYEGPR